MDQPLTCDLFAPLVGRAFRVRGGRHELTLSKVDMRQLQEWEKEVITRQPFTLIFSGPPRDVLPQGMYTFEVADGPTVELYVIPILTPVPTRQDYQSVFN